MSTAIQTIPSAQIAPMFTPEQEQMILRNFLGGASKEEAAVLLEIVKRRRLDPFSRQVYFVKRWDSAKREEVWAIQISIDGLRSLAERTGKYDGQDEPEYGKDEAGEFCKVKVYRKDWSANRYAMGIAYLAEFIQKKKDGTVTAFWARMPRLMLAKCAEALAIRKAFPEDAAGLYIPEEMGEASAAVEPEARKVEPAPALPPSGERAAPREEAPKTATQPRGEAPPPHVLALWGRAKKTYGTQATAKFAEAAAAVFGAKGKPSHEWTVVETLDVEHALFPVEDVP